MADKITMQRLIAADIALVWELWTTTKGIESWWGPHGFVTKVHALDLRTGGELDYSFTATDPEVIAEMTAAGMPLTSRVHATYGMIEPHRRAVWTSMGDFIPDVEPYPMETVIELQAEGTKTRLTVHFDRMHDDFWTDMVTQGWEQELSKLETRVLTG